MDYMNQMKIKIELNLGHEQYFLLPGPAPDLSLLLEAGQFPALSLRNSSPTPLCPASIDDTMIHIYSFVISPILIQYFSDKAKYCSYCNLLFPKNLYIRDFCCFDYSIAAVTSRYL